MSDTLSAALHGLFYETLKQFPDLKSHLPAWWQDPAAPEALTWATKVAAQGQSPSAALRQQHQRVSIFTRIFQPETVTAKRFIPITPLQTSQLLPQEKTGDPTAAYQTLLASLTTALDSCQSLPQETYLVTAADVLRRHTTCLPSPYDPQPNEPALSLYDHSHIIAALAPCHQKEIGKETVIATLISGDISGIQDFIYTITARGAISGLRGRSFYLQLLTEAIATYVRKELNDLPVTSILYAGGGHFYILAPGDQEDQVQALQTRITQKLQRHHRDLYVGLGHSRLKEADFAPDNFPTAWQRAGQSVSEAKNRRFSELGDAMFAALFAPDPHGRGGDKDTECRVCHYEGSDPVKEFVVDENRPDDEGDPIRKCLLCDSLEQLGSELRHAHFLLKQHIPEKTAVSRTTWQAALAEFGIQITLFSDKEIKNIPVETPHAELWALNDAALQQVGDFYGRIPIRLQYLVNETPIVTQTDRDTFLTAYPDTPPEEKPVPDTVKSFTLLQFQAKGIKRLGVLRMDVDDLGQFFRRGFGKQSGLVQTVALSTAVSLYFETWVAHLIQTVDPDKRDVLYSIYSGGDDLFIVGAWDLLPQLARRIAADLQAYAADNPHVHASAGITLHGGKFPLYQAAAAAEVALDAAKDFVGNGRRKNAFTFLNRTYPWSAFDEITADQEKLIKLVAQKDVGRSLLQHMLRLDSMYQAHLAAQIKDSVADPTAYWGRGQWLHVYQMSRLAGRLKGAEKQDLRQEILDLRDKLRHDNFKQIQILGLSARWAELVTRHEQEVEPNGTTNE